MVKCNSSDSTCLGTERPAVVEVAVHSVGASSFVPDCTLCRRGGAESFAYAYINLRIEHGAMNNNNGTYTPSSSSERFAFYGRYLPSRDKYTYVFR